MLKLNEDNIKLTRNNKLNCYVSNHQLLIDIAPNGSIHFKPCCRCNDGIKYTTDDFLQNGIEYIKKYNSESFYISDKFDIDYCTEFYNLGNILKDCLVKKQANTIESLDLALYTSCNYKCVMCTNGYKKVRYSRDVEILNYIIDNINQLPFIKTIITSGSGEISLYINDTFFEKLSKSNVTRIVLITNGYINMSKYIEKWNNRFNITTVVSCHASNRDLYKKITNVDGFDKCIQSIIDYDKICNYNQINYVVQDDNVNDLFNFIDFIKSLSLIVIIFKSPSSIVLSSMSFKICSPLAILYEVILTLLFFACL